VLVYIPIIFPAEGRAHEASWVRGKVRRLLLCFASMRSGRHGAPPPVTRNRREELADGEANATLHGLAKSAARAEKPPHELVCANPRRPVRRSAARRPPPAREDPKGPLRRSGAPAPLVFFARALEYPDARTARARKRSRLPVFSLVARAFPDH